MACSKRSQSLVHLQRLQTPALIALLLFMETLLGTRFQCPDQEEIVVIYCLMYLFLPAFFLVISNLLLRARRSSSVVLSPPPITNTLVLTVKLVKAPLIWILIVLLNRTFLSCLFRNVNYIINYRLFPSLQICSLISLVLCLALEYYSSRFPFLQKHLQYCNRKRHEDLVLREIEIGVQKAADERRKTFVQSMISPDLDKLNPADPGMQDVILHLIQQHQEKVQRGFTEEKESRRVEAGAQDPRSAKRENATDPDIDKQN